VTLTREVVYRYRDQAIGEVRRPLFVTRDFDVAIAPMRCCGRSMAAARKRNDSRSP